MTRTLWHAFILLLGLLLGGLLLTRGEAVLLTPPDFDHSLYDDLLRSYVTVDGLVNYEGLQTNSLKDLQTYLDQLANVKLAGWSYEQKLSFWINAYNAHVIQQVLNHPEMKKINDHLEIFDVPLNIAKGSYSLNDIEHRIIRGKINKTNNEGPLPGVTLDIFDPRIHFALVCGAIDCPKLRNVAYGSKNLEALLRENSSDFANTPKYVRLEGGHLRISSLMKWYAEDFEPLGGPSSYLNRLVDLAKRKDASEIKKHLIADYDHTDFQYSWKVNDIRYAETQHPKILRSPK